MQCFDVKEGKKVGCVRIRNIFFLSAGEILPIYVLTLYRLLFGLFAYILHLLCVEILKTRIKQA